jgi:hypothetical protein
VLIDRMFPSSGIGVGPGRKSGLVCLFLMNRLRAVTATKEIEKMTKIARRSSTAGTMVKSSAWVDLQSAHRL